VWLWTARSAAWTNFNGVVKGVSHRDAVDWRKRGLSKAAIEDITGFYTEIAYNLKQLGF
jgi:hypothetical protein